MPDHAPRARKTPPGLWDRVRLNALSLRDCGLAMLGGVFLGVDALIPDERWIVSYSLASVSLWLQVLISVLLVVGGLSTVWGVLARSKLWPARVLVPETGDGLESDPEPGGGREVYAWRLRSSQLAPLTTLMLERLGWMLLAFGWGTTAVAVRGNGREGSTLFLVVLCALVVGAVVKALLLWQREKEIRAEVEENRETQGELARLGEGGGTE